MNKKALSGIAGAIVIAGSIAAVIFTQPSATPDIIKVNGSITQYDNSSLSVTSMVMSVRGEFRFKPYNFDVVFGANGNAQTITPVAPTTASEIYGYTTEINSVPVPAPQLPAGGVGGGGTGTGGGLGSGGGTGGGTTGSGGGVGGSGGSGGMGVNTYVIKLPKSWKGTITSGPNNHFYPLTHSYQPINSDISNENFQSFRNYYVKIGGSDAGSGTITAEYATIQKAANVVKPGDTVFIKNGTYKVPTNGGDNTRVLKVTNLKGTEQFPITFTAYQNDTPILDGTMGNGQYTAIEVIDSAYLNFSHLKVQFFRGIAVDFFASTKGSCHHIVFEYCEVSDRHPSNTSWGAGIRAKGPCQYITFRKNHVHHYSYGIALWENPEQNAVSCFVPPRKGNLAPGSPQGGYPADMDESQWQSWEGWTEIAPRYCVIEDNICNNNTSTGGPQNSDNFGTRYSIDCIVRNNIGFNDNSGNSMTIDDNFDMTGATRMQFYGNIAFNCTYLPPYPPTTGSGNGMKIGVRGALSPIVHHNISFYNYRMGLDMGYSVYPKIYNNTIYYHSNAPQGHHKSGDYGIFFEGLSHDMGVICVNNIVNHCNQPDIGNQNWVRLDQMDYNCISDSGTGSYASPQGSHSLVNTDPLFLNPDMTNFPDTTFQPGWTMEQKLDHIRSQIKAKFGLQPGSPCINTGLVVPGITDGFNGTAPDMGAIESN